MPRVSRSFRASWIRRALLSTAVLATVFAIRGVWEPRVLAEAVPTVADAEIPQGPITKTPAEERLLESVRYLASDELEGRGVGTNGLVLAGEYIRREFAGAGLDVTRVEKDAYQQFTMVTGSELTSPNILQFTLADGATVELKHDADFRTCSFGGSGTFDSELVLCGYGIEDKDSKYDDFAGLDVKGKVVVMMRRTPRQTDPHGPFGTPHGGTSRQADLRTKVNNAVNRGAAAILFVNDPYTTREAAKKRAEDAKKKGAKPTDAAKAEAGAEKAAESVGANLAKADEVAVSASDDVLMPFGYGGRGNEQSLPILHITQAALNRILTAAVKTDLTAIESEIDKDLKPQSTALPIRAKGQTSLKRVSVNVRNVIGVLEGQGPNADETIIVGAHYDHVGRGGEGSLAPGSKEIHNGADDNASGTAALLELGRRLASRKERLPRRVVFIAFTAEELGLIGSARYVKEPTFPLEKTVAMFNMDMVGRLQEDKLTIFGTGTSSRWKPDIEELGPKLGFKVTQKPEGFGPSDHSSFYAKKIPVLHLFTGNHRDYHRPSDDWDKINVDGIARIVDLLEEMVVRTATTAERPDYVEVKSPVTAAREGSRPYFGSIPDFGTDIPGYAISGVAPGSPAEKGGLKGGDVIVEIGQQKVTALDDFDLALRKFKAGDEVPVVVLRKGARVPLKVTLGAPR